MTIQKEEIPIEIENILKDKRLWDKIVLDELDKKIVKEYEAREILFVCAMGSLVKNANYCSFNLLIHSDSSAGKDFITKNVLSIVPERSLFSRTRISPTVLNYWKPYLRHGLTSWDGCMLYLPDISESVLNSDAFKLMCSDGSHITITEKGEAKDIEIKGKPVIFTTTATSTPNEEIINRFSIIHLTENEEQTLNIMKRQANKAIYGNTEKYEENMLNALNFLKRYNVKIPFADKIVRFFPKKRVTERRNFDRFLDFIKAITCVHQLQRESEGDYLIAEISDYDKAKDVFMNIQRGVGAIPLNKRQKDIVGVLKKEEKLSLTEIHTRLGEYIALKNLRPHLDTLVNLRVLNQHHEIDTFNREVIKYELSEEYSNFKPIILPNGIELDSYDTYDNNYTNDTYHTYLNSQQIAWGGSN